MGDLAGLDFFSQAYGVSADGNTVVGFGTSASGTEAFRWTGDMTTAGLGFLSLQDYSTANGASSDGSVVVGFSSVSGSGTYEAFRWTTGGGMVGLGDLPDGGFSSIAYGVSADGNTVVGFGTPASGTEAFIWDTVNGMRNLKTVLVNDFGLNLTGWTLTTAQAVSSDGMVIVGYGTNPGGFTEAWMANLGGAGPVVPEPATLFLLLSALLSLFGFSPLRK